MATTLVLLKATLPFSYKSGAFSLAVALNHDPKAVAAPVAPDINEPSGSSFEKPVDGDASLPVGETTGESPMIDSTAGAEDVDARGACGWSTRIHDIVELLHTCWQKCLIPRHRWRDFCSCRKSGYLLSIPFACLGVVLLCYRECVKTLGGDFHGALRHIHIPSKRLRSSHSLHIPSS